MNGGMLDEVKIDNSVTNVNDKHQLKVVKSI